MVAPPGGAAQAGKPVPPARMSCAQRAPAPTGRQAITAATCAYAPYDPIGGQGLPPLWGSAGWGRLLPVAYATGYDLSALRACRRLIGVTGESRGARAAVLFSGERKWGQSVISTAALLCCKCSICVERIAIRLSVSRAKAFQPSGSEGQTSAAVLVISD